MRTLPTNLAQKLEAGVTTLAQAWRITRADGMVVAITQHDRDLAFANSLFKATHSFLPSDVDAENTLAPDRTSLSGPLHIDAITDTDLSLGRWDNARVEAFLVDWVNPSDFVAQWQGRIKGAHWRGQMFELDIVGEEAVLAREVGRVYARACDARLGDGRCKLDMTQAGRRLNVPLSAVLTPDLWTISAPMGGVARDFVGGRCKVMSGIAAGWQCEIVEVALVNQAWQISLVRPCPVPPHANDQILLEMGCDKSFATCAGRFSNALNFRGQPQMPGDDVALGGPAGVGHDGGKR